MKGIFKNKKWIAFLMALILVAATGVGSSDAFLWASGGDDDAAQTSERTTDLTETPEEDLTGVNGENGNPALGAGTTTGSGEITAVVTPDGGQRTNTLLTEQPSVTPGNPEVVPVVVPENQDEILDETDADVQNVELPDEVKSFVDKMKKLPEADGITEDNAAEVLKLLGSEEMSDGYVLALEYQEDEEVKAARSKYEAVYSAADKILGLGSSLYDDVTKGFDNNLSFEDLRTWVQENRDKKITLEQGNTEKYWFKGTLTIPAGTTVTVRNIGIWRDQDGGYNGPLFRVEQGATLILENMSLHGTEGGNDDKKCTERYDNKGLWANGPLVEVYGTLNLNSGAYLHSNGNNGNGGGVYVHDGGSFYFDSGATIDKCDAIFGGGVFLETGANYTAGGGINNCRATGGIGDDVCWESDISGDPRLVGQKLFLTILTEQSVIPTEPTVITNKVFLEADENYNVTKLGWGEGDNGFSSNAAAYISASIFSNPNFKTAGDVQGLGNSTEANLKNNYLIRDIDWDKFLVTAVASNKGNIKDENETIVTSDNVGDYELYPYVIKKQSDGWHIDCIAKAKDRVTLTYELNLKDKVDNLDGFSTDNISGRAYNKGAQVTVGSAKYKNQDIAVGDQIEVTKNGYPASLYFVGWNTSSNGEGKSYKPDDKFAIRENTTLYGVWTTEYQTHDISYTVEYYKDGVKVVNDTETVKEENVLLSQTELQVKPIAEDKYGANYELAYYKVGDNDEEVRKLPGSVADGTTIEVHYTAIEYTIEYRLEGGALKDGEKNPETYTINDTVEIKYEPIRANYTFKGWILMNEDGSYPDDSSAKKPVTFGPGETGIRTYKAVWEEDQKYFLTIKSVERGTQNEVANDITTANSYYAGTGYTFSDVADETKSEITFQIGNEKITIPKIIKINKTAQYIYDSGAVNGTISNEKENVVTLVYALDENGNNIPDYQEHSVTYDLNGGTVKVDGVDITGSIVHESVKRKTTVNISDDIKTVPTKVVKDAVGNIDMSQSYVFAEWKPMTSGIEIDDNNKFTMPNYDVTLQAQWKGMTVEKIETSTRPAGEGKYGYEVGQDITFRITVTNSGNVDLTNVLVEDGKAGAKITGGQITREGVKVADVIATDNNTVTLGELKPGDIATIEVTYKVTLGDKTAAKNNEKFTNKVIATAGEVTVEDETPDIPIDGVQRHLTVTKKIEKQTETIDGKEVEIPTGANGTDKDGNKNGTFKIGDTVTFIVEIKNDGRDTLTEIKVEDVMNVPIKEENALNNILQGLFGGIFGKVVDNNTLKPGQFVTIDSLESGKSQTYRVEYTIDVSDIGRNFVNLVRATAEDGTTNWDESEKIPVEEPKEKISVEKKITSTGKGEGGKYKAGEFITYEIKVTNEGNVPLENVVVKDTMTGATGEISEVTGATYEKKADGSYYFTIADPIPVKIADGSKGSATITYKYEVLPGDAGKEIGNTAAIENSDITPKPEPVTPDPIKVEKRELTVEKNVISKPADDKAYQLGEEIIFAVTVTNSGNVAMKGITLTDTMLHAAGKAQAVTVTGDAENGYVTTLVPGGHNTFDLEPEAYEIKYYSYTVQEADLGKTDVRNRAIATSKGSTPGDPDTTGEDTTEDLPVGGEYTLTVRYEYRTTGAVAAAAYTAKYTAGTEYLVYSPTVSGYDSSAAFVTGKMPCRNLELVVYYTASGTTDNPGGGGGGGNDEPTPPTPPAPPVGPVPVTPTPVGPTPVTPTPTGAIPVVITPEQTLAEVGDEAVPLQGALIDVDDDGNVAVTTISEEEVPLAGGVSDDHKCCILSFLLMLAALLIYTWYTYDMKKRQKRLAELADELEEETMKKQLGMAGAKQAK